MSKNIKTCDVTSNKISEPFLINEPIVIILSPHGELEINKYFSARIFKYKINFKLNKFQP